MHSLTINFTNQHQVRQRFTRNIFALRIINCNVSLQTISNFGKVLPITELSLYECYDIILDTPLQPVSNETLPGSLNAFSPKLSIPGLEQLELIKIGHIPGGVETLIKL